VSQRDFMGLGDDLKAQKVFSPEFVEEMTLELQKVKSFEVFSYHESDSGSLCSFKLKQESEGTQKLFGLAGPILDVLENGLTLVVDELSNNLHPHVFAGVVSLFQDPLYNKKGAQLIFTTHDTYIMSHLSRD